MLAGCTRAPPWWLHMCLPMVAAQCPPMVAANVPPHVGCTCALQWWLHTCPPILAAHTPPHVHCLLFHCPLSGRWAGHEAVGWGPRDHAACPEPLRVLILIMHASHHGFSSCMHVLIIMYACIILVNSSCMHASYSACIHAHRIPVCVIAMCAGWGPGPCAYLGRG